MSCQRIRDKCTDRQADEGNGDLAPQATGSSRVWETHSNRLSCIRSLPGWLIHEIIRPGRGNSGRPWHVPHRVWGRTCCHVRGESTAGPGSRTAVSYRRLSQSRTQPRPSWTCHTGGNQSPSYESSEPPESSKNSLDLASMTMREPSALTTYSSFTREPTARAPFVSVEAVRR